MAQENNGTEQVQRNISITQRLLIKTYGENCPESMWPKFVDDGGYVILGSEPHYDEVDCVLSEGKPKHTWCRWGWDMGAPIRFDSPIDADIFVKTLNWTDEKGRAYARGYIPHVAFAGKGSLLENDRSLPTDDSSDEDYEEED